MRELARSLGELEAVIEGGLQTFLEVGTALLEIRDGRLYREQGYATFEDYCRQRWDFSRIRAHQLIEAAGIADHLLTTVNKAPITERQARELVRLTPEQQRSVASRVNFTVATALP